MNIYKRHYLNNLSDEVKKGYDILVADGTMKNAKLIKMIESRKLGDGESIRPVGDLSDKSAKGEIAKKKEEKATASMEEMKKALDPKGELKSSQKTKVKA